MLSFCLNINILTNLYYKHLNETLIVNKAAASHDPQTNNRSSCSTLIDNISSNSTSLKETESGNVTSIFSDHLPQFIFLKDLFSKTPAVKSNTLRPDWRKFESNKFISDFDQTDWEHSLCTKKSDVNFSMNQYLSKIDSLLKIHAILKA